MPSQGFEQQLAPFAWPFCNDLDATVREVDRVARQTVRASDPPHEPPETDTLDAPVDPSSQPHRLAAYQCARRGRG
jgi:hypothetical protein